MGVDMRVVREYSITRLRVVDRVFSSRYSHNQDYSQGGNYYD